MPLNTISYRENLMSEFKHTAPACKPIPHLTAAEITLFYSKINRTPTEKGCHLWTGYLNDRGYALFLIGRRRVRASRIQWVLSRGEDPFPWLIRHTCDVEGCVREEHLIKGSDQDNMADAVERRTMASGDKNGANTHPESRCIGSAQPGSKLTEEQVATVGPRYMAGETSASIAKSLGVSETIIARIVRGEIWKHAGAVIAGDRAPKIMKPRVVLTDRLRESIESWVEWPGPGLYQ